MISFTYGVMPSHEQFLAACAKVDPDSGRSVDDDGFAFGNDKRVGNTNFNTSQLWDELQQAHGEYTSEEDDGSNGGASSCFISDAGDWCSCVLYYLGFEWV